MSVYVDKAEHSFGRMKMCHMLADSEVELMEMADTIGVARKWIQRSNSGILHFDICKSKRRLALAAGAIEVDRNQLVEILRKHRGG